MWYYNTKITFLQSMTKTGKTSETDKKATQWIMDTRSMIIQSSRFLQTNNKSIRQYVRRKYTTEERLPIRILIERIPGLGVVTIN